LLHLAAVYSAVQPVQSGVDTREGHRLHERRFFNVWRLPGPGTIRAMCHGRRCETMIPIGFPAVAPSITLGDLFGPLAPLALVAAVGALVVLIGLLGGEYAVSSRRRSSRVTSPQRPTPASSPTGISDAA
jgi:hypothetical protein